MTVSHCGLRWKYEFGDEDRGFKELKKERLKRLEMVV